jgi:hypothetical protein
VNVNSAIEVDGFDCGDFHGRDLARNSKLSPSLTAVVNIIVDNRRTRHVECALPCSDHQRASADVIVT